MSGGLIDDAEYERLMMFGGEDDELPVRVSRFQVQNVDRRIGLAIGASLSDGTETLESLGLLTGGVGYLRRTNCTQKTMSTTATQTCHTHPGKRSVCT